MRTMAMLLERPGRLSVSGVELLPPQIGDVVVDIDRTGISTGTERLLFTGEMPPFPGLGYPLVPGYEAVGSVVEVHGETGHTIGARVFVPGASCYQDVKGLFGGSASRLVVRGHRAVAVDDVPADDAILLALAATAFHATAGPRPTGVDRRPWRPRAPRRPARDRGRRPGPDRLGDQPRAAPGRAAVSVLDPAEDTRRDYRTIVDVSGDSDLLDTLVGRLAPPVARSSWRASTNPGSASPSRRPSWREARFRIAAEWKPGDMAAVMALLREGTSLARRPRHAPRVRSPGSRRLPHRFRGRGLPQMVLDWSNLR